jgi:hypothetical protein
MPDRNKTANVARPEFEVAYYTKELGNALQREMLQKQLNLLSDSTAARHGEDAEPLLDPSLPQDDRAG